MPYKKYVLSLQYDAAFPLCDLSTQWLPSKCRKDSTLKESCQHLFNTSLIYSTISSSNRGIKKSNEIFLKSIDRNTRFESLTALIQMQSHDYAWAALWDTAIK